MFRMKVATPKEIERYERRVAATPETVKNMVAAGLTVAVETHAGKESAILDTAYQESGAHIVHDVRALLEDADIILKVQKPGHNDALNCHEVSLFKKGAMLISFIQPLVHLDLVSGLHNTD